MNRTVEPYTFRRLYSPDYKLRSAWEVIQYSNIIRKSLAYLDLILPKQKSLTVCTEEACKKSMAVNRKILYKYHLDISRKLDLSLRNVNRKRVRRTLSKHVLINQIVLEGSDFEYLFNTIITETLRETNQKVEFIHKISKLAKNLKIIVGNSLIYENGLILLFFQRADSNVLGDFLPVMKFDQLHYLHIYIEVFDFILLRAHTTSYYLWSHPPQQDLIHATIFLQKYKKTVSLLQYFIPRFCNRVYENMKESGRLVLVEEMLQTPIEKGLITRERHFLILQILYVFHKDRVVGLKALQMLWRSIRNPFITIDELHSVFSRPPNAEILEEIGSFIEEIGVDDLMERGYEPRKLKHYCRLLIRSVLFNNRQLPKGIDELNLPSTMKSFLRLEV